MDSKTSREVLDFLKELNEEGNTIVIITHDSSIALEAKRVVRVHDGKTSRFVSADQMYGFYEEQGRNIQYSDIVSRQKVCVVGYYVAGELYGSPEKAIDQTVKIGGYGFRIVGGQTAG